MHTAVVIVPDTLKYQASKIFERNNIWGKPCDQILSYRKAERSHDLQFRGHIVVIAIAYEGCTKKLLERMCCLTGYKIAIVPEGMDWEATDFDSEFIKSHHYRICKSLQHAEEYIHEEHLRR